MKTMTSFREQITIAISETAHIDDATIRNLAFTEVLRHLLNGGLESTREPLKKRSTAKPRAALETKVDPGPKDLSSKAGFFATIDTSKPANAVWAIIAWSYHNHGCVPITSEMIREEATATGLIVPADPNATLRMSTQEGKKCFQKVANGYMLTVMGELYLKKRFGVSKGKLEKENN